MAWIKYKNCPECKGTGCYEIEFFDGYDRWYNRVVQCSTCRKMRDHDTKIIEAWAEQYSTEDITEALKLRKRQTNAIRAEDV